jgi:hypothetical protein
MAHETGSDGVLRKSLDAVDAVRRRMLLAGYVAVAGTLGAFVWFDHLRRTSDSLERLIEAAVLALTLVIAWSTFALAILIARMTKRIVRAIDLAANRR